MHPAPSLKSASVLLQSLSLWLKNSEAIVQRCSVKKVFLDIWQISQENTCARVYFLLKAQASALQLYLKIDSGTSVFL